MQKRKLTILTFNTAGVPFIETNIRRRYKLIAAELNRQKYDIINLQEVHLYPMVHLLKKILTLYPYVSYKKSVVGPKGGLVTFSKIPILATKYHQFPKIRKLTFHEKMQVLKAGNRGILEQKIEGWTILNVHLAANLLHQWDMTSIYYKLQIGQIALIQKVLQNISKTPLVLTGDFNIAKNTLEFTNLSNLLSLQDIFDDIVYATYNHKFIRNNSEDEIMHIDQMFTSLQMIKIIDKGVVFDKPFEFKKGSNTYLSDHTALFAEVEMTN